MRSLTFSSLLLVFTLGCSSTDFHERRMKRQAGTSYCDLLNKKKRSLILKIANPKNFPNTRYKIGSSNNIEKSTDCSHFVHEVYKRAGLHYSFMTTKQLKSSSQFVRLRESEAKPGDLMLFRGHVGIISADGNIISATKSNIYGSAITTMPRNAFRSIRGKRIVLRYQCEEADDRLASKNQ